MIQFPFLIVLQFALGAPGPLTAPTMPPGLEVELRTGGNQTTFHLSELVPLEVVFRAERASTFSIEIADGWNKAPAADRFVIEPYQSVIDRNTWWLAGIACCQSRRSFLTPAPAVYAHELTDFVRFTQPGEYRIQYATRRVFAGPPTRAFDPSDLLVRSNVVTIRIVEDDPQWLHDVLPAALAAADRTPVMSELRELPRLPARGSLVRPASSAALVRYQHAVRQLRLLDTPEAIRAKVARLQTQGDATSIAHASRPDLVAAALREYAAAPDFGVTRSYVDPWARAIVGRDHPEHVRLNAGRVDQAAEFARHWQAAQREVLAALRDLASGKTGPAAVTTAATIRSLEQDVTK